MQRFIPLLFIVTMLATNAFAQEQVLPSTPIYATSVEAPQAQSTAAKADDFEIPIQSTATATSNSTYAVGTTPSSSEVSPTGAFTYTVPIAVPPGVQDVQPNIALSYNSQSGNGLAGWGWNISGLSTISRIPSTVFHDGIQDPIDYDVLDRFALNGQRLMLKSGTYGKNGSEYQTEQFSNLKVVAYGTSSYGSSYGPSYFVVFYPDGSRAWYGRSNAKNRLEWAIDKWQDSQGNYVSYSYVNNDGLLRINAIYYGSVGHSHSGMVKFVYKNRSRYESSYIGGHYAARKNILSHIEVKNKGALYRKYQLTHRTTSLGYERITQIQESNAKGEKRAPVVFSYGSNQTKTSISANFLNTKNFPGVGAKTAVLTGNFNYDSNLDAVTYDVSKKNQISIITGVVASGNGSFNIGSTYSVPKFKDIFTSTILLSNGSLLSHQGITTVREEFSNEVSSTNFNTMVLAGIGLIIYDKKKWTAPTRTDYLCDNTPLPFDEDPKEYGTIRAVKRAIPKTYVSGDFNGDGITDVLAIEKSYTRAICDPPNPNNCDDRYTEQNMLTQYKRADQVECDCQCDYSNVNYGVTYFIDLDQRKKTDFAHRAGSIGSISSSDPLFAADYDGDGKTELWHITNKKISVYTLINNQLQRIVEFSDDWIKTDLQILKGDFNGDGKLDLLIPKQNETKEWCFLYSTANSFHKIITTLSFEYKKSFVDKYGYLHDYQFFAQDFNQDGKSDLIKHYVRSRDEPYGYYPDGSLITEYYNFELFELFENKAYQNFERTDFVEKVGHFYEKEKYLKNIKPVFAGINTQNKKMQYAVLSGTTIKRYDISTPHRSNMQMRYVSKGGMHTKIYYAGLDATDYGSIYQSNYGQKYPYINVNHAPGMELVK